MNKINIVSLIIFTYATIPLYAMQNYLPITPLVQAAKAIAHGNIEQLQVALSTDYFKQNPTNINVPLIGNIRVDNKIIYHHATLLNFACAAMKLPIIEELLKNPYINVNTCIPNSSTSPLRLVLMASHIAYNGDQDLLKQDPLECKKIVRLLCERGAHIERQFGVTSDGKIIHDSETILHQLAKQPPNVLRNEIFAYLLEHGGNPLIENKEGLSIYAIALYNRDTSLLTLCKKALLHRKSQIDLLITRGKAITKRPVTDTFGKATKNLKETTSAWYI